MPILLFFLSFIFVLVPILISVAFFTLFERKILGYSHLRFGPNKNLYWGLFQPFSDALSLFSKLDEKMKEINLLFYYTSPIFGIFISLFLWSIFSFWGLSFFSNYSFIALVLISGFSIYFLLYSGWATCTKYSFLGSYRSSAQSVSYEVVMMICFVLLVFLWFSMNLYAFYSDFLVGFYFLSFPLFISWFLSCVAECNRSPFDFSEGESELVSGFNTEYGGGLFSLIFIGEYSSIIFLSLLTSLIFFSFFLFIFFMFCSVLYLLMRVSFPRLRYDFLMMMGWSSLLILLISLFFFMTIFI